MTKPTTDGALSAEQLIGRIRSIAYPVLSLLSLALAVKFGSDGLAAAMWMSFSSFLVFLLLSHIPEFKKFSAGVTGISAEMREAKEVTRIARDVTEELRHLAADTARISLSLIERAGRVGGFSDAEKQDFQDSLVAHLRRVGVEEEAIEHSLDETYRYRLFDYRQELMRAAHVIASGDREALDLIERIRTRHITEHVSPEEVKTLFIGLQAWSPFVQELIEDYGYYMAKRSHRRLSVWIARRDWPKAVQEDVGRARSSS